MTSAGGFSPWAPVLPRKFVKETHRPGLLWGANKTAVSNTSKHQVGSRLPPPATSLASLLQLQQGKTGKHKTILETVPGLCRGFLGPSITAGDKNCGLQRLAWLAWAQGPADHSQLLQHAL